LLESAAADAGAAKSAPRGAAVPLICTLAGHEVKRVDVRDLRKERRRSDADITPVSRDDRHAAEVRAFRQGRDHRTIADRAPRKEPRAKAQGIGRQERAGEALRDG